MPIQFKTLREAVKRHFTSERHLALLKKQAMSQEADEARRDETRTIAMRVLRTAYHVLKKSHSQAEFEELTST